jgi:DSF synthase
MSALPSYSFASSVHQLPQARFTRRVVTELRQLASKALWVRFNPDSDTGLQNFTSSLVGEFQDVLDSLVAAPATEAPRYTVLQSSHPEYFSVGGDLRFFRNCIEAHDAKRLRDYSMKCLDLMYGWSTKLKGQNTSIALVQGRALGGGFEMVLSTDYVIAEQRSSFGFPEIMFGLFPCTGAMGLLAGRVGARQAERMMTNKKIYSAAELHAMGLIDELCEDGQGERAVERYIEEHTRRQKALFKVQQSRYRHSPLNYQEGVIVVDDWVETAMSLCEEEVRTMEMLMMMQRNDPAMRRPLAA